MDLHVVKFNGFYKIILIKTCLGMTAEFGNGGVKPDGLAQVELIAGCFQGMKYFMRAGVVCVVTDHSVSQHAVVFKNLNPEAKHGLLLSLRSIPRNFYVNTSISIFFSVVKYGLFRGI